MPDISPIDRAALKLLASSREAIVQDISERAMREHERAALLDTNLTTIGQLGSEAVRLYSLLERREKFFMGKHKITFGDWWRAGGVFDFDMEGRYDLAYRRRKAQYAQAIIDFREGDISQDLANSWAGQEINRNTQQDDLNRFMEQIGEPVRATISASGYEYFAPPILRTEPEYVGDVAVYQQWRVLAELPCSMNKFVKRLKIRHEFRAQDKTEVTIINKMTLNDENGVEEVVDATTRPERQLEDRELFFPLGVLIVSREALVEGLPKKLQKMVK